MSTSHETLTDLFRQELELCDVTPDESVAVVTQSESRDDYERAFLEACRVIGADTEAVQLPGLHHPLFPYGGEFTKDLDSYVEEDPSLVRPLTEADMVIAVSALSLVHSDSLGDLLDADTRVLIVQDPPAVLERMLPSEDLRERVERAEQLIRDAETVRVVSDAGTDISMTVGDDPWSYSQFGYVDEPGEWDHFPGGFAWFYPVDDSPNGRIVLDTRDAIIPPYKYVDDPIEIVVEDGYITEIIGDDETAEMLRGYYDMWDEEAAYATSHFGFGLDETGVWEALDYYRDPQIVGQDMRGYAGGFMWSTGPNREVGRDTRAHVDFPMRNCTVYLDDTAVVQDGDIVEPSLRP